MTWWSDGDGGRIFAGVGRYVYALNARTGDPISTFGKDGRIDLHQDLGRDPETQSVSLTSPGIIYKDLLIVGGRESEGLPASYGDIRAYDVRTGELRWTFHTIPRPGEYGYETWPKDAWTYTGAANNWAGMAIDLKRGIVLRADRLGGGRFLRRQSRGRQSFRQLPARAGCRDRQAPLALPGGQARHLGPRFSLAARRW